MVPASQRGPSAPRNPSCLACGAAHSESWGQSWDAEYLTTNERFSFHHCLSCNVLFIDPVPIDRIDQIYPPTYYSFASPRDSVVFRIKQWLDDRMLRKLLQQLPGAQLSALDIGGGAGLQLDALKALDSRVTFTEVVDLDPGAVEIARKNGHESFCGRIEEYETDKRFDLVLLLNLIEHVANPLAVLRKVHSVLSPQGVVLVKTPNFDSFDARLFRHLNWGGYHCPRHWVLFTKDSFAETAAQAGLKLSKFAYTQGAPFWATSILALLAERNYISITKERPAMFHPLFPALSAACAAFDFVRSPFAKLSQMFFVLQADDRDDLKHADS